MRGEMLWFDNEDKQHGFITTEDGERLRVDRSGFKDGECPEGKCKGMDVEFVLFSSDSCLLHARLSVMCACQARRPRSHARMSGMCACQARRARRSSRQPLRARQGLVP